MNSTSSNAVSLKRRNGFYLICAGAIFPFVLQTLITLSSFPSLAKLGFFSVYCIVAAKVQPKYQILFVLVAYPHTIVSMLAAKQYQIDFPSLWAAITLLIFISYIGAYRGFSVSKLLLLLSLLAFPFIALIEPVYKFGIWSVLFLAMLLGSSWFVALWELFETATLERKYIYKYLIEVWRSSHTRINALLLIALFFLVALQFAGNNEQQAAGQGLILSFIKDITEFFSADTRGLVEKFLQSLLQSNSYNFFIIYFTLSVFFFQSASHHSRLWYGVGYIELLGGESKGLRNPYLKGPLAIFAWTFASISYYAVLLFSVPIPHSAFSHLTGPVTWKTTLLEVSIGYATGLTFAIIAWIVLSDARRKRIRFKFLRLWVSKKSYVKWPRLVILFGAGVVAAPFFAWKTIVSTVVLLAGCYILISV
jgi:hypothetical protein